MVGNSHKGFGWLFSLCALFLIFAFGVVYHFYQFGLPELAVLLDWVAICVLVLVYIVSVCACVVFAVRRLTMRQVGLSDKTMFVEHAVVLTTAVACAAGLICIAIA